MKVITKTEIGIVTTTVEVGVESEIVTDIKIHMKHVIIVIGENLNPM